MKKEKFMKKAVALSYEAKDKAPKILAIGEGELAERIIQTGEANQVPVYEDAPLSETLSRLSIGDAIPAQLYEVVAEILVFVSDMDRLAEKVKDV